MLFILLYYCSFMMVIENDDWFLIWLGMELNMMSFLFLFYCQNNVNIIESCMKYFFIQSLGSALFVSFIYMHLENDLSYLGTLILSYKLGAGPFFFWFPSMVNGFGWMGAYFLMSFQKIIPLMLIVMFMAWMLWFILIVSLLVGVWGSFNQSELKMLFAYSSIHHLGWLFMCEFVDTGIWIIYLFIYMLMMFFVVFVLWFYKLFTFSDMMKWERKWWFVLGMVSLAGVPPFLGFFLKWMAFYYILTLNWIMIFFMLIMTMVMFYVYMRIVYEIMLGSVDSVGWYYKFFKKFKFFNMDLFMALGMLLGVVIMLILVL